ncbi:MAG TPA: putative manganese-dependent inorganic diphosphatase [Solirubrobacteraceae bacterium]|nr:putative manganese-dependent inorganic diphosphatase [Solirubrobacteraceae bacterium]
MRPVYVTGHKNPDTDSIAAAIGYAEFRRRQDPDTDYVPVRLGDLNAQTTWVLERAGIEPPRFLAHVSLRVKDVMHRDFARADIDEPVRHVGLMMAEKDLDLLPVTDRDGKLAGIMTERVLARKYIRESRAASSLVDAPTSLAPIAEALDGEVLVDNGKQVAGRVWVYAMDAEWEDSGIGEGDAVVVGNREDAQRRAIEIGVDLLVVSNASRPTQEILDLAKERGTSIITSKLDSYVSGRMITLAAPCSTLMDDEPTTVRPEDLISDVSDTIKDVHYGAVIAVDHDKPVGVVSRSDLVRPEARRVILVDHAEQAQTVPGIDEAEIVEILDHHHIGSIETRVPVRATFDPVGSTATLVVERFRQTEMKPSTEAATVLLGAVLSDTVILNSPTTTDRDREVVRYLEKLLDVDATEFGREMFEAGSDVSEASAEDIVMRDAKEYEVGNGTIAIAQVETVGAALADRTDELLQAVERARERNNHMVMALMVTDILEKGTTLLVGGDRAAVSRAFEANAEDGVVDLPGVMSRKKQVAPRLLGAF